MEWMLMHVLLTKISIQHGVILWMFLAGAVVVVSLWFHKQLGD
jgi:hypothetical protein